jgi:hypothetical protein
MGAVTRFTAGAPIPHGAAAASRTNEQTPDHLLLYREHRVHACQPFLINGGTSRKAKINSALSQGMAAHVLGQLRQRKRSAADNKNAPLRDRQLDFTATPWRR